MKLDLNRSEQKRIYCYFETRQCESNNHSSCAGTYEYQNIEAKCNCKCHKEREKVTSDNEATSQNGMLNGVVNCISTNR